MNATAVKLEQAIKAFGGNAGPGSWVVDIICNGDRIGTALCYKASGSIDFELDAPWKTWGGDEILSMSGMRAIDKIIDSDDTDFYDCAIVEPCQFNA